MTIEQMLSTGGVSAGTVAILFALYKLLSKLNHKKLRSSCCGKEMSVGVAVETLTPEHSAVDLSTAEKKPEPV